MITHPSLRRFSKPRRAGDQTSGGRGKLLKTNSDLTRVELLIRETLQNSWDARRDDLRPTYGVRVRESDAKLKYLLLNNVFTDLPESLEGLRRNLTAAGSHVLEIFDRGTTGLDGPIRASVESAPGEPNNFNSFVFDIGTTKSTPGSGGTYGFGKTAAFEVSGAHAVVYWSVCIGADGDPEHRLIASVLHDPYAEGGARYTGAHWWGDPDDADVIPLTGSRADELGQALFQTPFDAGELGTSILIIDPVITVDSGQTDEASRRVAVRNSDLADRLTAQIERAVGIHAWPKVTPDSNGQAPMSVQVFSQDRDRELGLQIRERYSRFGDALMQVRDAQAPLATTTQTPRPSHIVREETFAIQLRPSRSQKQDDSEFFGGRADNVAGHVHLSLSLADPVPRSGLISPSNTLCLMRSQAELVVYYDEILPFDEPGLSWHAVFKPTPECDKHFASSEPSTHDAWTPNAAENEVATYVVSKSLAQIRRKARNFLEETRAINAKEERSVRRVATALRSFVPLGPESSEQDKVGAVTTPRSKSGAARRQPKVRAEVTASLPDIDGLGHTLSVLVSALENTNVQVRATLFARTPDGRMELLEDEARLSWNLGAESVSTAFEHSVPSNSSIELHVRTRTAVALEVVLDTLEQA
ncbi:hypothetical protein [Pseudoclavibacter sp. Z016]|uniref:hypothetical protein n=1 Tax=Pseudoclavibacter sp. Z016 TaxID=2080581 RepID=UPI000CE808DA|nr:hypothetical protein [Pseudoclavibacter sp. Z016]PPF75633.1 hypothetical protein C5B99_06950 [Pseudoclavibacter sp. Z016]